MGLAWLIIPAFSADLLTIDKHRLIRLVPDAGFGAQTTWDMMFKAEFDKKLVFLPDGGFLKPAYRDGKVFRFDAKGSKIAEFGGRVGQGPGDLNGPTLIDILDGTTIVVFESVNKRLSLFGLDGQFQKIVKIESPDVSGTEPVLALAALSDGKIAVVSKDQTSTFWIKRFRVIIKDLGKGAETEIASFVDEKPQSPIFIKDERFDGSVFLARAGNDKLLNAYSKSAEIAFYSPEGKSLATAKLDPRENQLVHPDIINIHGNSLYALLARPDADGTPFLARIKIAD